MPETRYINGRFLTQPLSGVQRFATEITAGLRRQDPGRFVVLAPQGGDRTCIPARVVGHHSGQRWEQFELPSHVAPGVLINLGNTAPLRVRSQVVVIHDAGVFATPEAYSWKFRLWYKFLQKTLVHRGTHVVAVSEFSRQELMRWLGLPRDAISLVSEGADHMQSTVAEREVLAKFPPGRFVLAVGNLSAHKNLAALGELAVRLARRGVSLVITGARVNGAFRTSGPEALPQPAHYIGRVSDGALKALYEAAACLVFPSSYEAFGLPAVEAMACGCAIAASRIPALEETCGEAAQYFDPASQGDIAEQVCRLLDDEVLATRLRAAGRVRATSFTWSGAAAQLADIVDRFRPSDG